jgi:hypothetical protein
VFVWEAKPPYGCQGVLTPLSSQAVEETVGTSAQPRALLPVTVRGPWWGLQGKPTLA